MHSAIVKDFFREIKKSFSRWLSILFIVALGVAFFSGIRATSPDMKMTLDNYLDQTQYMDIRVLSTLGLTDEDILAISEVEDVAAVEPSKTYDAYVIDGEDKRVLHFLSQPEMIGQYELVDGRDIRDENECVVDRYLVDKYAFRIGDRITVTAPGDDDLSDHLSRDTYEIVGVVSSSSYFTTNRDTTDIGTGMTDAFVYLSRDVFVADYYSAAYIIVRDAAGEMAFSDQYDRVVGKVTDLLDSIKADRENAPAGEGLRLSRHSLSRFLSMRKEETSHNRGSATFLSRLRLFLLMRKAGTSRSIGSGSFSRRLRLFLLILTFYHHPAIPDPHIFHRTAKGSAW